MTWLENTSAGATPFDRVFGLRPNLQRAFLDFQALFWERELVPPVTLELCRLRVAQLLGCASELGLRYRPALNAGLDEAKIQELPNWGRGEAFSQEERACLSFAEMFVQDPHAITDADAELVLRHLGEPGFVALTEALAIFDGFARFRAMLGIEPESDHIQVVEGPSVGDGSLP